MKVKRIISAIAAFAVMTGILPAAYASDSIKNNGDSEYLCFDLTPYANCVGFADSYEIEDGIIKDGVDFKVPNYIGAGNTETPADYVYNKTAVDMKKDTDGFVYDEEGMPYLISTESKSPNFPILGSAAFVNNREFTINADNKKLYEIAFLADAGSAVYAANFELRIEYTDGTIQTDDDWVVNGIASNPSSLLGRKGVESYISFPVTAASETNPNADRETALKYRKTDPAKPWGVNQYIPAYKLKLNPEKNVKSISFKNTAGTGLVLAVFGVTVRCVTKLDEISQLIDTLPENDEINYGNYLNYKDTVEKVLQMITDDIVLDSSRNEKITEIAKKIEHYENNPEEGVIYLIDLLPDAENINKDNFANFIDTVEAIKKIYSEDMEIAADKIEKYLLTAEKITRLAEEKKLADLINALPDADGITVDNYFEYSESIEEIEALIEKGVAVDDEAKEKFDAVYSAHYAYKYRFNPFVTVDYSQQCNAIMYGEYGMTLDDPKVRTPFYLGTKNSDVSIESYPTDILNKKAFEGIKDEEGIVYTENKKIPFDIDTDRAIILGTNAIDKTTTVTIPVSQGNYKSIYMTYCGTFRFDNGVFKAEIQYTDGTVTKGSDTWQIQISQSNLDNFKNYPDVYDYFTVPYDSKRPNDTAYGFKRNNRIYDKMTAATIYVPILRMEANPEKTVKSLKLTMTDPNRAMGVIAITAELPEMSEVKSIIENKIAAIDSTNISKSYDDIYAVSNMLEKYQKAAGAQPISGIEKFEAVQSEFENSIIEVKNVENNTTVKGITSIVEFTNPISTADLKNYINMTLNGEKFTDYKVEAISDREILISIKNDFDYNKDFGFTLSSEIRNAQNKNFTLRNNYSYSYKAVTPFEVLEFSVKDENNSEVTDINAYKGKNVAVSLTLKNNTMPDNAKYAMTLCLYDDNNRLEKVYLEQHELGTGKDDDFVYSFAIPDDEHSYRIDLYVWDGYTTMNKITQNIGR